MLFLTLTQTSFTSLVHPKYFNAVQNRKTIMVLADHYHSKLQQVNTCTQDTLRGGKLHNTAFPFFLPHFPSSPLQTIIFPFHFPFSFPPPPLLGHPCHLESVVYTQGGGGGKERAAGDHNNTGRNYFAIRIRGCAVERSLVCALTDQPRH